VVARAWAKNVTLTIHSIQTGQGDGRHTKQPGAEGLDVERLTSDGMAWIGGLIDSDGRGEGGHDVCVVFV
jgi:hypothetical protein